MKAEELIEICKNRNEIPFLFSITKHIAETDSIGEGYNYCHPYKEDYFNNAEKDEDGRYCKYLEEGSLPVYLLYLKHIGHLQNDIEFEYF